ncbi:hypothetical protein [Candidatus Halobonum tyrrellensis]|uniref:DUF8107 domain-containing protein n=1 Tax=Candidatus Halobonum tyrrellensis G22 TaxID=1324957 RepID=V4HID9_9EURY|nr:hypothetical protein [Candidatus Halobonum tyrrellensis]ESP89533.1 hypothetical protein K933_03215 [Candidatus Halobonum tyrrellensis G22]
MADDSAGSEGFDAADSDGDPRVLFAMNVVLSSAFAAVVVWGLSFLGIAAFSFVNVATLAALLVAATYLVTR